MPDISPDTDSDVILISHFLRAAAEYADISSPRRRAAIFQLRFDFRRLRAASATMPPAAAKMDSFV